MSKIFLTCGGTGGHIFPAVALAENIKAQRPDIELVFGGRKEGMEKELLSKKFSYVGVSAKPFTRKKMYQNVWLPFSLFFSVFQAYLMLRKMRPKLVFATGGYVTLPYMLAAKLLQIHVYFLELNAVPGLANRVAAAWAKGAFTPGEYAKQYFKDIPVFPFGNPTRSFVSQDHVPKEFSEDRIKVLVMGGSQGAKGVNRKMDEFLQSSSLAAEISVVWQTGKLEFAQYREKYANHSNIHVFDFIDDIYAYLGMADLVISRSGAATIAEVLLFGKAVVFIPYPFATDNHQEKNARAVESSGAALVELESENSLSEKIELLINDAELRNKMASKSLGLACPNATERIVEKILELEKI
jgi:UDP-N-acetylglucosamine--N-acetylmuramyl-(pentapeptide) pyrophosphoryl-undecaprenol N-acetylglucosamine transferase